MKNTDFSFLSKSHFEVKIWNLLGFFVGRYAMQNDVTALCIHGVTNITRDFNTTSLCCLSSILGFMKWTENGERIEFGISIPTWMNNGYHYFLYIDYVYSIQKLTCE